MKPKKNPKLINPQDSISKLVLHFNIDRTIIMRDSLSYDNSDIIVSFFYLNLIYLDKRDFIRINMGKRRQKQKWRKSF